MAPDFENWAKPYLKIFLRKSLNFRTKKRIFEHITLKESWLATWFIFELIGVWASPDVSELQAFKNVSLQMVIDKTFTFCRTFHKKLRRIQVFDV